VDQHMLELGVRAGKRHHGPVPGKVGDAAGSLTRSLTPQRVCLLKIGVGRVENDRLPLAELVVQNLRQLCVAAFSHAGGIHGRDALALIVVHVEMLGLDDLEIERAVLDLVPAEVLGVDQSGRQQEEKQGGCSASQHKRPQSRWS
jgi:hypothetical protein